MDQDGEIVDVYYKLTGMERLLSNHGAQPKRIVTDKLINNSVTYRELVPDTIHDDSQYANNRAELSYQQTQVRERGMRWFKLMGQAQRFLGVYAAVCNLFDLGRYLVSASCYRDLRQGTFASWKKIALVIKAGISAFFCHVKVNLAIPN